MKDGVLYQLESDKTLRLIPPEEDRRKLFDEAHSGVMGGSLARYPVNCQDTTLKPQLTPIPVARPFDWVGVDVIQFPKSHNGNQYAAVFVDYLTKWPEVFATPDQSAATIACLLVEHVVSCHGVPAALLSDRGAAFLSKLMAEVNLLLGIHKVNTTAYHPQTDGLVERFNWTLTDMLAKTVDRSGADWDQRLPYVLFAHRSSMQQSTMESPFYLLYGRDPRLPKEDALCPGSERYPVDVDDYRSQLVNGLSRGLGAGSEGSSEGTEEAEAPV